MASVTHTMRSSSHQTNSRAYFPFYLLLFPDQLNCYKSRNIPITQQIVADNRFHRNEESPQVMCFLGHMQKFERRRNEKVWCWTDRKIHKRAQRAPCLQWHSCSVAHIQAHSEAPPPICPRISWSWFEKKEKRKEKNNTCVSPRLAGPLSKPCVSRTARILKAPHFMSPHAPDSNRWALLLLPRCFSLFPSVTIHPSSGPSI